jgi:protein subunit release factor A
LRSATHLTTGIVTTGQEERSRAQNTRSAFGKMAKLLVARVIGDQRRARWPANSETIRTYHKPDNRVVDHDSGFRQSYDVVVTDQDLSGMIEARHAICLAKASRAGTATAARALWKGASLRSPTLPLV